MTHKKTNIQRKQHLLKANASKSDEKTLWFILFPCAALNWLRWACVWVLGWQEAADPWKTRDFFWLWISVWKWNLTLSKFHLVSSFTGKNGNGWVNPGSCQKAITVQDVGLQAMVFLLQMEIMAMSGAPIFPECTSTDRNTQKLIPR